MVWIFSKATQVGMATSSDPPNISQAAKHKTGRTRLPPAIKEYRMDSQIKSVCDSGLTTESINALVMAGCLDMMYSFKSNSVLAFSVAAVEALFKAVLVLVVEE
jgi:hypothetical protein